MIAIARPSRRYGRMLAIAVAVIVPLAIHLAPREPRRPRPRHTYWRIIPLTGTVAIDADPTAAGRCAALVDELVTHPRWQLHVADRSSGCLGTWDHAGFVID